MEDNLVLDDVAALDVDPVEAIDDAVGVVEDAFEDNIVVTFNVGVLVDATEEVDVVVDGLDVAAVEVVVGPHIPQYLEQY